MPVEKSVFRWLLPKQSLLGNPDTEPYVREPGDFIEWSAADRRLVAYPCSNDTILNLCAFLPSSEAGNGGEGDKKGGFRLRSPFPFVFIFIVLLNSSSS